MSTEEMQEILVEVVGVDEEALRIPRRAGRRRGRVKGDKKNAVKKWQRFFMGGVVSYLINNLDS